MRLLHVRDHCCDDVAPSLRTSSALLPQTFDELFRDFWGDTENRSRFAPRVDVTETETRVVLESAIEEGWNLEESISDALGQMGCRIPTPLKLEYERQVSDSVDSNAAVGQLSFAF